MTMNLFHQFASPHFFGVPLVIIAMLVPWLFILTPSNSWVTCRNISIQALFFKTLPKQILQPLNAPGHKWAFLITALMIFLLSMNILGLFPNTFTPTTQLSMNLGLAIPMWLSTVIIGVRKQFTASAGHLLPEGTPTILIPALILIETTSLFIRPLALGVRLTANLTAGHLLIHLISMALETMLSTSLALSSALFMTLMLLTMLEIAVAMIQAYVFVLLLSLYLQENT
uniref:ATP synthase F0 subunit 6 n=1 Tax=Ptychadena robeensis TaxID=2829185 RepID=UPI00286AE370|nr:ATP synthase F0 subunit 6 [Ptychadena robeensis]WKT12086.1 ATP synthase F0 subunit 6 [Ptychadena robeensis]WKT12099.1 ATP synthase F0 subunit 6 [Ptychadena robeensis]WKT12112.1 ATP synthase F0 subunit 6 [Ptychadena robeensis]WKT12125.1 ATP synthase F0 subunit 6 [Ptychadena robeensis]WKT12138.1 ATP synthase F0 subunit 6 [Ptychadena robeensis]